MNYSDFFIDKLKKLNCNDVLTDTHEGQSIIRFQVTNGNATQSCFLFHHQVDNIMLCQLMYTLPNAYKSPETDFYRIIDKLNTRSILGHLMFQEEPTNNFFLTYKATAVFDMASLPETKSFDVFFTTSMTMLVMFSLELSNLD